MFKKGFNTKVTEYIGEYSLVINKGKYLIYKSLEPLVKLFNPIINK
jgi:lipid II:glycine glycyltransferase (peptidoglycan interpeptide bridge formation enzyme)